MPLFHVAVREHTYTGRFYSEAVQAESPEEALQVAAEHAAVPRPPPAPTPQQVSDVAATGRTPAGRLDTDVVQASRREEAPQVAAALRPPPGPTPQGFSVVVTEQADTGAVYSEVVQAGSPEEALQVAAEQAAAPEPPPGPTPQAQTAGRPRCADVWVYALLHCELEAGHDPPHMAVAHRYRRAVRWVRGRSRHRQCRTRSRHRRSRACLDHAAFACPGTGASRGAVHGSGLIGFADPRP